MHSVEGTAHGGDAEALGEGTERLIGNDILNVSEREHIDLSRFFDGLDQPERLVHVSARAVNAVAVGAFQKARFFVNCLQTGRFPCKFYAAAPV